MTGILVIVAAFFGWLGYVFFLSVRLIRDARPPAGVVCILMGGQDGVAEWFIRCLYRMEKILTGRLAVAVAVAESADDTAGIVGIMAAKKPFFLIDPEGWLIAGENDRLRPMVMDVRGMDMEELRKGPLALLKNPGARSQEPE